MKTNYQQLWVNDRTASRTSFVCEIYDWKPFCRLKCWLASSSSPMKRLLHFKLSQIRLTRRNWVQIGIISKCMEQRELWTSLKIINKKIKANPPMWIIHCIVRPVYHWDTQIVMSKQICANWIMSDCFRALVKRSQFPSGILTGALRRSLRINK